MIAENEDSLDLLAHLPERYRPRVEAFLQAHWVAVAARCYAGFLAEGRGVMLIAIAGSQLESEYLPWTMLQAEWDYLLADADRTIQQSLHRFVPHYNPAEDCVFLFEFPADDLMSVVMHITQAALAEVSHTPGSAIPTTRRWRYLSPKAAYEQSDHQSRSPLKGFKSASKRTKK